jgi:tetratricopeptide (TPR) repeat protein/DNA-binding PadR family transcriptional regulator
MTLAQFNLTIEDGILLHLYDYIKFQENFEVPVELSQPGIAQTIGIRRSHVSYALKSLKNKEFVFERIAHVTNVARKRKIYLLTPEGITYTRKILENLEQKTIRIGTSSNDFEEVKLSDISKRYSVKISILELIISLSSVDVVNPDMIEKLNIPIKSSVDRQISSIGTINFIDNMTQPRVFLDREKEQEMIKGWLSSDLPRVIVIQGIPGMGKTTLASKIVHDFSLERSHSLFWFKLHEWDTSRSILFDLAEFLNRLGRQKLKFYLERETKIELPEVRKALVEDLKELNVHMIFDDLQKIQKNVEIFFTLLVELFCSEKMINSNLILLTREFLGLYDRREVAINNYVKELELLGLDSQNSKELLKMIDLPEADFEKIYDLTSGHPLSIELIGFHLAKNAKDKIELQTTDFNLSELFKGQHELNKYINEEVYQRLLPTERELLEIISVFRYPVQPEVFFTSDSINHETIDSLVGKSILYETDSGYDIHEIIREFFYHRLTPDQKKRNHDYAGEYYLTELDLNDFQALIMEPSSTISILEALHHYFEAKEFDKTAKLLGKYGEILVNKGFTDDLNLILSKLNEDNVSEELWSQLLIIKGFIQTVGGEWDSALENYQASFENCQNRNDQSGISRALNAIGVIHYRKGDLDKAMECYNQGLECIDQESDLLNASKLFSNMALIHWGNGELENAIVFHKRSLEIANLLGDKAGIARAHNNLGIVYWEQRDLERAIDEYNKSLALSEELGDKRTIAILYDNLAEAFRLQGEIQKAQEYYEKSLELSEQLDFKWQIAEVNCNLGILFQDTDKTRSQEHLKSSLELYIKLGAKREVEKIKGIIKR